MKSFILMLLLIPFNLQAQYVWFEGNNLYGVSLRNGNSIIAVGGGLGPAFRISTIVKLDDNGNINIQKNDTILYAISFSDENNGTAVGAHGLIIRTMDGGNNWFRQESGTTFNLNGVSFTDENIGTAVGGNLILRTTDGGKNWNNLVSGTLTSLYSVSFVDKNIGFTVGQAGRILSTKNGGNIWIRQSSGTLNTLYGVSFSDSLNGVAVGARGTILKTTDGGEKWEIQNSITSNHLYGVSFVDGHWTAVGERGTIIKNGIIQSSGTENRLNGVSFSDENNGKAVGWFGTVLQTTDGGLTWENNLCNQIKTHHFVNNGSDRNYYVFLPRNYSGNIPLPLMILFNGSGGTGEGAVDASRMSSVADTSGFLVVYPSWGSSWSLETEGGYTEKLIDSVHTKYNVDLSRIYVGGFSRGGFTSHELGCKLSHKIAAIAPIAGTIQSSTILNCNSAASLPVFYMHGTKDATVSYNGVKPTLTFWRDRNDANASVDTVYLPDIDTTDGSTVTKYSYKNSNGDVRVVYNEVINGGHNWSGTAYEFNGPGYKNMDINTSEEIWNFVKDFSLEPTSIHDKLQTTPNNFHLSQNYPNPFNPSTTISWQSPVSSWQTLKVYDLLGREVVTLVDEFKPAGSYEVEFDASALSSGTYFYRLTAGGFVETKKLILLR